MSKLTPPYENNNLQFLILQFSIKIQWPNDHCKFNENWKLKIVNSTIGPGPARRHVF